MEIIDYKSRTARKAHTCFLCGAAIEKGESYEWQKNKHNDQLYEIKVHKKCADLAIHYDMYGDCYEEGLTADYFYDLIREAFNDTFTTEEKVQLLYKRIFGGRPCS